MYFPESLLQAARTVGEPVTGFLLDARPRDGGFRGAVFFDALSRHEDGTTITTSQIIDLTECHGYTIITTTNGTRYVVVSYLLFVQERVSGRIQTRIMKLVQG